MKYWMHWHNVKYEIWEKRVKTNLAYAVAKRLPQHVRLWVVVQATNEAREMYPDPSGYAGPEGLSYTHLHDAVMGERFESHDPYRDEVTV